MASQILRCFRNLLLVICPHLLLKKAPVPDLEPTGSGNAKFGDNMIAN
jgi:hypothetical protein